jgi:hypothetical protein
MTWHLHTAACRSLKVDGSIELWMGRWKAQVGRCSRPRGILLVVSDYRVLLLVLAVMATAPQLLLVNASNE